MSYVTTLIAPQQAPFFDDAPIKTLAAAGITITARTVLEDAKAVDLLTEIPVPKAALDAVRDAHKIDALSQSTDSRVKKLFMADMDATMVAEETLDELAAYAGLKDKIAAITVRAMNGEIDFKEAVRERVGLLKGLPLAALSETADKITFTQGGHDLLKALKANGVYCVLVSGGFTYFTGRVAQALGFDENHGNTLNTSETALSGTVAEPILDKNFKKLCLEETTKRLGATLGQTVAIGDGANDLPMLETAGLGVGFHGKKLLRDALTNHIVYGDLEALIYTLGLKR